jgi:flagellar hook assembly protein FlgD
VALKLYNASGKLVKTIFNEKKSAGTYSMNIDNNKLKIANGVYFIKLEMPDKTLTEKIIILP